MRYLRNTKPKNFTSSIVKYNYLQNPYNPVNSSVVEKVEDMDGEGIISNAKKVAENLYKHRQLIKKIGSKASDFYTGEYGTKIKNLIPSSDDTARPAFQGENHAILRLKNGKQGYANYMGPGTNVIGRVERGDMGRTPADMVAKRHDIDYQLAAVVGDKKRQLDLVRQADKRMVNSLNNIQRDKRDNWRNIQVGKRLIQAKMIGENVGVLDKSRFAGDLETISPEQRNMLVKAQSKLEQEGYGMYGMYPADKLKMKILSGMTKGRKKKKLPKSAYKQVGKGLNPAGMSGGGLNPAGMSGGFIFAALAGLTALITEAVSAVTVASVGSAAVSGAVSAGVGVAVKKIAGGGKMRGRGVEEVVKKVAQKVAEHKGQIIKVAEKIGVKEGDLPNKIREELQKRLDKINREGGDKNKVLGVIKTLIPVVKKIYHSKLAKQIKGNVLGGQIKVSNENIMSIVKKSL
jgi:hypothetical protein